MPRAHRLPDPSILAGLVVFRAINSLVVKTYFSPDEYWQALEVGHRIAFGEGYLTWEWDVGLRSVLHPAMFAALYRILALVGLDDGSLFIHGPRLLQSLFAALADFYTYKFTLRLFENRMAAYWTLFLSVLSWWNFFCSTRTLANSMEAALTIMALYYWPFDLPTPLDRSLAGSAGEKVGSRQALSQGQLLISLGIASLTCVLRPTAAILWAFLGFVLLAGYIRDRNTMAVVKTALSAATIGGGAILGSAYLDTTLLYSEWIITPINFLQINVVQGISLFYGSSPWHWYLSQGLPILFGIYLPLVGYGVWQSWKAVNGLNASLKRQVLYLCLWLLVVYSSLQHKEWRFLYPILYPLLPFAGDALYTMSLSTRDWKRSKVFGLVLGALVAVNAVMGWYTTMIHQRGVIDVMAWLRNETKADRVEKIGFIMPCHSTPWYSDIHLQGRTAPQMWFLTCEPPLYTEKEFDDYEDESDIFYKDPVAFMEARKSPKEGAEYFKESHLVLFQDLIPTVTDWLDTEGYQECARFFNSHFHDDSRRRGDVLVYCTNPLSLS